MLRTGILNPHLASLLARVRHTNLLVIADRSFPFSSEIETVDLSLVDDIPTVPDVLRAILSNFSVSEALMAEEFFAHNGPEPQRVFTAALDGAPLTRLPHVEFKRRVPSAIGLLRTGDSTPYANVILVSG
jgi:D-ribose pyranase